MRYHDIAIPLGGPVAAEMGTSREELDDLTALRWEQYAAGQDFRRGYQVPVEIARRKAGISMAEDEGVRPKAREAIGALPPAAQGALHTFASQTHPADGCAGAVVTTAAQAREMSGGGIVRLLASGFSRAPKSRMPQAPVPAAMSALADAGLTIGDVQAITTHNPFAVNDLYFARETGVKAEDMNVHGCSLVFGHPQGPTGLRSIAELIETLLERGGGIGLFTGCAAGDTGAAIVVEVADR
jgi:acetyl-CoA C-acetyltransferase